MRRIRKYALTYPEALALVAKMPPEEPLPPFASSEGVIALSTSTTKRLLNLASFVP